MPPIKIGVLAIQGSFKEHMAAIARFGTDVAGVEVRVPPDLTDCAALILPGGESTSLIVGLKDSGLLEIVRNFAQTKPVWGVCAGVILLADRLESSSSTQPFLGGLDITVKRNAFGRQVDSKFRTFDLDEAAPRDLRNASYFIRAPLITQAGARATKLATVAEGIVAVRDGNKLATCFHPEISHDDSWLTFFLTDICKIKAKASPKSMPALEATGPWAVPATYDTEPGTATKRAFAIFQQGGVIMDVVNGEQARIAEAAGAVSVMALERIPADIKADGGVARSSDPRMIKEVLEAITIPCMAKARIGHFYEARVLEALKVDCIDESEVLTAADEAHHIDKRAFKVPFVCGAQDLGEALRRISEGASMIRLKGNAGTGNVMNAVRHARAVFSEIRKLKTMREDEIYTCTCSTRKTKAAMPLTMQLTALLSLRLFATVPPVAQLASLARSLHARTMQETSHLLL